MQVVKPTSDFQHGHYNIQLRVASEKNLAIMVTDSLQRSQYHEQECVLENIGVNTLFKAFQGSRQEIKVSFSHQKIEQNDLLEVKVTIESAFLKPVSEVILLKKTREVSEEEIFKKALDSMTRKIKELRNSQNSSSAKTLCSAVPGQKNYNGASYETIGSIKLLKGKYLLTVSFFLKTTSEVFCFYFNRVPIDKNQCYYTGTKDGFLTKTYRRIHTVTSEVETYNFETNYGNSHPANIRNLIITVKPLSA